MQFPVDVQSDARARGRDLIESLLIDHADHYFLEQLDQSRSMYKDIAKSWFQVVLWTGLPARVWPELRCEGSLDYRLERRNELGQVSTFSLILFDDEHLEIIRRFCFSLLALDEKGVDRSFHQSRQLYARTSKMLWPDGVYTMGFRTALELFRYRYLQIQGLSQGSKMNKNPWRNWARPSHVVLPNPRNLLRKTQLKIEWHTKL